MAQATSEFEVLNQFFDHIYVITLQRAVERHAQIKTDLAGLNFHFFEATDYKDFSVEELIQQKVYDPEKAKAAHRYGKVFRPGVIACSISHKNVYADIMQKGYARVLILEDDVQSVPEGVKIFAGLTRELPEDWGLVFFDYNKNTEYGFFPFLKQQVYHVQKWFTQFPWSHHTIRHLHARKFSPHLRKAGYHDFSSAYAITMETAKILWQLQSPVTYSADNLLAHASSNELVRSFISIPKIFEQRSQFQKDFTGSYVEEA